MNKYSLSILFIYLLYVLIDTASARLVWGVSETAGVQSLIQFDSASPGTIISTSPIKLGNVTERLIGIDLRPANGLLYGVSNASKVYTIGADGTGTYQFTLADTCKVDNGVWAIDFNPLADALRLISGSKNYRITSIDNQPTCFNDVSVKSTSYPSDTVTTYEIAYSNNFKGTNSTSLYALVSINGGAISLGQITTPNNGSFANNVALSVEVRPEPRSVAFDSYFNFGETGGSNVYIAALRVRGETSLYTLSLSGTATLIGKIGDGSTIIGISAALTATFPFSASVLIDNTVVSYGLSNPSATTFGPIYGAANENFLSFTLRPANYQIYAITASSKLYILYPYSPTNYTAVLVGTLNCTLAPSNTNVYSTDFNPVADRLRIVSSTGENYRVNADNAACFKDGNLFYADGSTPRAWGVAYTNGFRNSNPAALGTIEYIIDGNGPLLARVTVPNNGNTTKVGSAASITARGAPFDIYTQNGTQYGFVAAGNSIYSVDLTTGVFTFVASFSNLDVQPTGLIIYPADYTVPAFPGTGLKPVPTVFRVMVLTSLTTIRIFSVDAPSVGSELPVILPPRVGLIAIALRPVSYQIYAISNTSDLFLLYPYATNVTAYYVGTIRCRLSPSNTNVYSADFNPAADRLRIVSSTGENYRVNVADAECIKDNNLFYVGATNSNSNSNSSNTTTSTPQAVGVAYTNGFNSTSPILLGTAEYIIDQNGSRLSRVVVPNNGNTTVVGNLGFTAGARQPVDILTYNGLQYAYTVDATSLIFINLNDATSSVVTAYANNNRTNLPWGIIVFPTDYSLPPLPTAIRIAVPFVFNASVLVKNSLATFNIFASADVKTLPIDLPYGEELLGISLRPATYRLYAVSASGHIYILTAPGGGFGSGSGSGNGSRTESVASQRVATIRGCSLAPTSTRVYSFDFNPAADRLRIVSSTGQNFRVNVDSGDCMVDGNLFYIDGKPTARPTAAGVAYTNSFFNPNAAMSGTTEYILDADNGGAFLSRVVVPNSGNTTLVGALTVPPTLTLPTPLDILTVNGLQYGYAATIDKIYYVELASGYSQLISTPVFSTQPSGFVVYPRDYVAPSAPATTTSGGTTGADNSNDASTFSVVSIVVVIASLALYLW